MEQTRTARTLYHIAHLDAWMQAVPKGVYGLEDAGGPDPFIHLSTATQAEESAERHFAGQEGLVLLVIDAARIKGDLKWETVPARDNDAFPHLFGSIPLEAVRSVEPLPLLPDGKLDFPFLKDDS
ncbi:MAG: DUF952 domain-containing protein [Rhodospirillaceae bacterium]